MRNVYASTSPVREQSCLYISALSSNLAGIPTGQKKTDKGQFLESHKKGERLKTSEICFFSSVATRSGTLIKVNKNSTRTAVQAHFECHLKLLSPGM